MLFSLGMVGLYLLGFLCFWEKGLCGFVCSMLPIPSPCICVKDGCFRYLIDSIYLCICLVKIVHFSGVSGMTILFASTQGAGETGGLDFVTIPVCPSTI